MLSPFIHSFSLLAAENRILEKLPPIFGLPTELLLPVVLAVLAMIAGIMYGKKIRMEDHGWQVGLIGASFLASLAIILFWEYKLGVDLQGGAILVYEVDEKATAQNHPQGRADDWQMSGLMEVLKRRLNPDGLKEIVIRPFGPKQVEIVVPEVDAAGIEEIKKKVVETGILRFLILADSATKDGNLWEIAREQAASTDPVIRGDRNVKDPTDLKSEKIKSEKIIGYWATIRRKVGNVEPQDFAETSPLFGTLLRDGQTGQIIATDRTVQDQQEFTANPVQFFHRRGIKEVEVLMVCDPANDIRGSDLSSASEGMDEQGRACIHFSMKEDSIWKMTEKTSENRPVGAVTRKLGILWDGELQSAPSIQSTISASGQITGDFSHKEVKEKVALLRSGSMPVVLNKEPISDDRIGATLGADTVAKGSRSIVVALAIVFGFVMFYYRTGGAIACFALGLNVLLTVALMFAMRAPFTLPGLAGLVLTVGMSVDSNVLVYERLREELEKGASLRMAIRNGFDKAFVTIVDSNVTVLLTSIILYVIGTDQVRGFGMTVMLGVITSMFTGVFASRVLLEIGEKAYRWTTMGMVKWFTHPHIDWMKLFVPTSIASAIIIVVGLIGVAARGAGILDIDLAGGTSVQFVLDPKEYPNPTDPQVRAVLDKAFDNVKVDKKGLLAETGDSVEHNVYQTYSGSVTPGKEGKELKFWKVDSSLQEVKDLQKVVRDAFRTADGKEGIQTYEIATGEITDVAPVVPPPPPLPAIGPIAPPVTPDLPKTETPKVEEPKKEEPKAETPKTETPKAETPAEPKKEESKKEEPKADAPKGDAEPKKEEPKEKDSADCQAEDEKKGEVKKTDDKKPEDKKPEEPKPAETKPEPAAEPAKTEPAKPEVDPAKQIPEVAPVVPVAPAPAIGERSQVQLNFGDNKINSAALLPRISDAAKETIGRGVTAELDAKGWKGDNQAFTEWQVTLPLSKEDTAKVISALKVSLEKEPVWQTSSKIGGQVAGDTQYRALFAIIGSLFVMILYMWIRFHKISWGIAAAVALAHDALVMLGAIAISYWLAPALGFMQVEEFKISLPVVAAFLTLIGYSVNDTIVIFDRVREIRGKSPVLTGQMVNDAVNQTLSRTFLTGGLTLVVVIILYFFGGSGIHAFAFSLVVGVISGSYSTVFIASPLLVYLIGLDQEGGQKKKVTAPAGETRGAA